MTTVILAFLISNAVPMPVAHALIRFADRESHVSAHPPASAYHCMFQLDNPRFAKLVWFTGSRGCPDWREQVSFALAELSHPRYRCVWRARTERAAYEALLRTFGLGGRC